MRTCSLSAIFSLLLVFFSSAVFAADRVVLVIGNSAYEHTSDLANPANDATDIAQAFKKLGYEVTLRLNLKQSSMNAELRAFRNRNQGAEHAIVYFAGHGIEIDHENYLIPTDAHLKSDLDVEFEAVPLENVARAVEGATELSLVVLDACRDNPFLNAMIRNVGSRSVGRGLAKVEPRGTTLVAYAAREGTLAADGTGRNSPYATALLDTLAVPGVEIGFVFRNIRDAVLTATGGNQEPHIYGTMSARKVYIHPLTADAGQALIDESALDRAFWESVRESNQRADINAYLRRFPNGKFVRLARRALEVPEGIPGSSDPLSSLPEPKLGSGLSTPNSTVLPLLIGSIQQKLNALGCGPGALDGAWGKKTAGAVNRFYLKNGSHGRSVRPDDTQFLAELLRSLEEPGVRPCPVAVTDQLSSPIFDTTSILAPGKNLVLSELSKSVWAGPVSQPSSRTPYSMTVQLRNGLVNVDYPELSCGGIWEISEITVDLAVLRERIRYGTGRCINNGYVHLRMTSSGRIQFQYRRGLKSAVLASANLNRR